MQPPLELGLESRLYTLLELVLEFLLESRLQPPLELLLEYLRKSLPEPLMEYLQECLLGSPLERFLSRPQPRLEFLECLLAPGPLLERQPLSPGQALRHEPSSIVRDHGLDTIFLFFKVALMVLLLVYVSSPLVSERATQEMLVSSPSSPLALCRSPLSTLTGSLDCGGYLLESVLLELEAAAAEGPLWLALPCFSGLAPGRGAEGAAVRAMQAKLTSSPSSPLHGAPACVWDWLGLVREAADRERALDDAAGEGLVMLPRGEPALR